MLLRVCLLWPVLVNVAAAAARGTLEIRHVANAGVALSCNGSTILVDALFREGVPGYETHAPQLREAIESARPPFNGVLLILATHNHRDHFDAGAVAAHLESNPGARFDGTSQTASAVRSLHPQRVKGMPRSANTALPGGEVRWMPLAHNRPHRTSVENTAYLVRWCGTSVFVSGDAEVSIEDFRRLPLDGVRIDTAVLPYWFALSDEGRAVIDTVLKPTKLMVVHGWHEDAHKWVPEVRRRYPNATIGYNGRPVKASPGGRE